LYCAAKSGNASIVSLLLQHNKIQVNLEKSFGWLDEPHLKNGDGVFRCSPLCAAAMKGHKEVVSLLISHPQINVNLPAWIYYDRGSGWWDSGYFTPLMIACLSGEKEVVEALLTHPSVNPYGTVKRLGVTTVAWEMIEGKDKNVILSMIEVRMLEILLISLHVYSILFRCS
jgi:ankyrin repeat protein